MTSATQTVEQHFARYGPGYRWLVTIGGLLGAMVMILSATMVNVAVPSIMGAFGVGQDLAQWASTAFLATMVASQLLNTWIVTSFGQRLTFSMTLVVFTIGSLICAASPTIEVLIAGRILQGFSAGVIQPLVMATIITVFPADRRGFAMGLYGMGVTLAPSFGPLAGGITIDEEKELAGPRIPYRHPGHHEFAAFSHRANAVVGAINVLIGHAINPLKIADIHGQASAGKGEATNFAWITGRACSGNHRH